MILEIKPPSIIFLVSYSQYFEIFFFNKKAIRNAQVTIDFTRSFGNRGRTGEKWVKTPVFSEIRKTRASSSRKEAMARFQSVVFLGDPLCLSLSKGSLTFFFLTERLLIQADGFLNWLPCNFSLTASNRHFLDLSSCSSSFHAWRRIQGLLGSKSRKFGVMMYMFFLTITAVPHCLTATEVRGTSLPQAGRNCPMMVC